MSLSMEIRLSIVGAPLLILFGATGASAQLSNPDFDLGPVGPVGNFGLVVGPPFVSGFWGAEESEIIGATECGTGPRSNPYMLAMYDDGLTTTQAWQAVDVTGQSPGCVNLSAWGNSCSTVSSPRFYVQLQTFDDVNGYGSATLLVAEGLDLDHDPGTWEQVDVCVQVPADTKWILAEVGYVDATLSGSAGYVDDVDLAFGSDCCPVPTKATSWGSIKSLYGR